jgi:hypothetical protein
LGEGVVGEGAIHAHTQDLGVGSFQRFEVLLEVFHLLGSTTRESENIEANHHVLLAVEVVQRHLFEVVAVEVLQREVWSDVADFQSGRSGLGWRVPKND